MIRVGERVRRLLGPLAGRERVPAIAARVAARDLSYLGEAALADLHDAVAQAEAEGRPGILIEVGCALGGSAIAMAAAQSPARLLRVYDVFGMPPPPSAGDGPDVVARYAVIAAGRSEGIGGNPYYGYVPDLLAEVRTNFRGFGFDPEKSAVAFVVGLVQETLRGDGPVAVALIDCDRYASVRTSLEAIAPRLARGGVMIVDDYESKSGCRRAVDEFLAARGPAFRAVRESRLHIVRNDRG